MILALLGCTAGPAESADTGEELCRAATGEYEVVVSATPSPLVAGEPAEVAFTLYDREGCPVDDVQQNHERFVHVLFVSGDLADFHHVHHEDTATVDAETLRTSSWRVQFTPSAAGPYLAAFDFAHQNQYVLLTETLEVTGAPPQEDTPVNPAGTSWEGEGLEVELVWDTPPVAGYEAQWHVNVTAGGADVTDLTQYLGADAHVVMVTEDLLWVQHTHAWFPGMDTMAPGMEMDHLYPGPYVPFHYTFGAAGPYKMWVQFAREADPEAPYTVPFAFTVEP